MCSQPPPAKGQDWWEEGPGSAAHVRALASPSTGAESGDLLAAFDVPGDLLAAFDVPRKLAEQSKDVEDAIQIVIIISIIMILMIIMIMVITLNIIATLMIISSPLTRAS